MTLLLCTHPQIQKIIHPYFMSVSPSIIFPLLSENNLRCIWSHGDFPCRLSQALLSTATSWGSFSLAPSSHPQLTFLPFLAIPPGSRPLPYPCSAAGSLQTFLNYPIVSWPWLKSHSSFHISGYSPFLPSLSALWIIRHSLLLAALFSFLCSLHSVSKKMLCPGLWVTICLCRKEWSE